MLNVSPYKATKATIKKALDTSNIVLISGGISVGDYDFVKQSLEDNQVEELFYKINQKPGKPLWFGTKKDTHVFGLLYTTLNCDVLSLFLSPTSIEVPSWVIASVLKTLSS